METTQAAELAQYLDGTVQELSHAHVAGLSFAEQVEILDLLAGFEERVAALRSTIIREADLTAVKSTDLAPLIHATSRVTAREAAAQVRLAKDLETYPLLRQAWTDGTLSQAQLRGIIRGLRRIPITLGPAQLDTTQQELLQWHDQLDPRPTNTSPHTSAPSSTPTPPTRPKPARSNSTPAPPTPPAKS